MSQDNPTLPLNRARPRRRAAWILLALLLLASGSYAGWQLFLRPKAAAPATVTATATVQRGTLTISGSASGTTAKGTQTQTVNWSAGTADLVVEKVLKAAGDTVAQGDGLLKLTDASVTAVRQQLETNVTTSRTALAQAEIDHQTALVDAKSAYESSLALKASARQVYNETIQSLADAVTAAAKALTDAKAIIHDNPGLITALNKSIASAESDLTSAQSAQSAAQASLTAAEGPYRKASAAVDAASEAAARAQYTFDWASKYAADQGIAVDDPVFAPFLTALGTDLTAKKDAEAAARADLDKAKAPYDQVRAALSAAQSRISALQQSLPSLKKDLTSRENELDQAKSSLANLQARYDQSIADQKGKALTASQTYDTSVKAGDNAQTAYDIAVIEADQALADARASLSGDEAALALFKTSIGDGTIRAAYAGTLTSVGYAADGVLTATTPVAVYSNAAVLTVSASVDQTDIASLSVGKAVTVTFSSGTARGYQGKIIAITMKAASTSISAVKYTVTVTVDGDVSALTAGQTVTVRFVKDTLENALYVDQKAIQKNTNGSYVQKQVNGQVTQVPVTTGQTSGQYIAILSGLSEGDVCVYTSTASATGGSTAGTTRTAGTAGASSAGGGTGSTAGSSGTGNAGGSAGTGRTGGTGNLGGAGGTGGTRTSSVSTGTAGNS